MHVEIATTRKDTAEKIVNSNTDTQTVLVEPEGNDPGNKDIPPTHGDLSSGIDRTSIFYIIEAINGFNSISNPKSLETLKNSKFTTKAYEMNIFNGALLNRTFSTEIIYNSKIRGRSGSAIFFTSDFSYVIKTIRLAELKVLIKNLSRYMAYYEANENWLLVRYHGIYELIVEGRSTYFVLMKNILDGFYLNIYDLKGNSVQRANRSGILTENDWRTERLQVGNRGALVEQIEKDVAFLRSLNLMDYSLVVGHSPVVSHPDFRLLEKEGEKNVHLHRQSSQFSIGIVDVLTEYTYVKWLENLYYHLCCMGTMSAVSPDEYQRRFLELTHSDCFQDGEDETPGIGLLFPSD